MDSCRKSILDNGVLCLLRGSLFVSTWVAVALGDMHVIKYIATQRKDTPHCSSCKICI